MDSCQEDAAETLITMVKLEAITPGTILNGLAPHGTATVIQAQPVGEDAVTVYYKIGQQPVAERMLFRHDEPDLSLVEQGRPWAFYADGEDFKLAAEAYRIHLAYLFDPMMAVHSSNVTPLPHQITAVYEAMLPRQPLRYVLADAPGAGKTIKAGLYILELMMRADLERCLIVSPGNLVEPWQDELAEKLGVRFPVFSRQLAETAQGNPRGAQSAHRPSRSARPRRGPAGEARSGRVGPSDGGQGLQDVGGLLGQRAEGDQARSARQAPRAQRPPPAADDRPGSRASKPSTY